MILLFKGVWGPSWSKDYVNLLDARDFVTRIMRHCSQLYQNMHPNDVDFLQKESNYDTTISKKNESM